MTTHLCLALLFSSMAGYQPLFIDFTERKVIIFGGGAVGERKARYFAGSNVTVVSREFTPGLLAMQEVRRIQADVTPQAVPGFIEGTFFAVAATGNQTLDSAIARIAGEKGIMVNAAEGESDVILPAKIVQGDILIAISTGGKSPAMARFIRQRLEESLGPELSDMVRLQSELREVLKEKVASQEDRERMLWQVLDDHAIWDALNTSYDNAKRLAIEQLSREK